MLLCTQDPEHINNGNVSGSNFPRGNDNNNNNNQGGNFPRGNGNNNNNSGGMFPRGNGKVTQEIHFLEIMETRILSQNRAKGPQMVIRSQARNKR
jgi:uncharacterized protein YjcR